MKRNRDSWFSCLRKLMRSGRGRPMACAVLVGLSLLNLSSEWPQGLGRPALIDTLSDVMPNSFGTALQLLFDHFQRWFPRIPAAQPVMIVEIDDKTLAAVGQWPWPRNRLAKLLDAIAASKPLAIGLDIYMPETDQT